MPKVSVLTPIYNTPIEHLKETIDSILTQTYTDFEYLIVNDSPDNTELDDFVRSYDDPRINYIKNPRNIGLEASTNKLLKKARGEYVAIFDHDDISMPERLEKEVAYLDEHPKVGVCSAQFQVFGVQEWTSKNPINNARIKRLLETESCVSHTTVMFRKSVIDKYGIKYEKRFFPAASYRIITRLALVTDMHNLPDILLKYRMDGNNTSIQFAKKRLIAREKLRSEYIDDRKEQLLTKVLKLDTITLLGSGHHLDERRYYRAEKDHDTYFIKSSNEVFTTEFEFAKLAYDEDPEHFIEPISTHKGSINFYTSRWNEGSTDLNVYMENHLLTDKEKTIFMQDLVDIFDVLWRKKIVHRDIIPRNFMVVDGHLKLIDFYWSVYADNYKEYPHVESRMHEVLSNLGEDFAAGGFQWDDAYSFMKVAAYIVGSDEPICDYPQLKAISDKVGKRVISPRISVLHNIIKGQQENLVQANGTVLEQQEIIDSINKRMEERDTLIDDLNRHIALITGKLNKLQKLTGITVLRRLKNVKNH